jgi:hypothetical protein
MTIVNKAQAGIQLIQNNPQVSEEAVIAVLADNPRAFDIWIYFYYFSRSLAALIPISLVVYGLSKKVNNM